MKVNLITGAGHLASRYLLDLMKLMTEYIICAFDPLIESLKISINCADEIIHNCQLSTSIQYRETVNV